MSTAKIQPNEFRCGKIFADRHIPSLVTDLDFSYDGSYLMTVSSDKRLRLYDCNAGQSMKVIDTTQYGLDLTKFTQYKNTIIATGNQQGDYYPIRYISLYDNTELGIYSNHTKRLLSLVSCPGTDMFFSTSLDETACFWDLRSPRCQGLIRTGGPSLLAVDPTGIVVAIWVNDIIKLYSTAKMENGPFTEFYLPYSLEPHFLQFSPDGSNLLVVGVPSKFYQADLHSGEIVFKNKMIESADNFFSTYSQIYVIDTFASSSTDAIVAERRINHINPGNNIHEIRGKCLDKIAACYSSDGEFISVGTQCGIIHHYDAKDYKENAEYSTNIGLLNEIAKWQHVHGVGDDGEQNDVSWNPISHIIWNPTYSLCVSTNDTNTILWIPQD